MKNKFDLTFRKDLTKLSGNQFGCLIFNQQVKNSIDYNEKITIIFPQRIDYIGTSFIQGFFEEIVKNIGIMGIKNNVVIESSIDNILDYVVENLE